MTGDPLLLWTGLALAVLAIALLVVGVASLVPRTAAPKRLGARGEGRAQSAPDGLRTDQSLTLWARLVQEVERRGLSLTDDTSAKMAETLALAGFHQPYAQNIFTLVRAAAALALPAGFVLVCAARGVWPSQNMLTFGLLATAFAGLHLPGRLVSARAATHAEEVLNAFPDTLDLLLVCLEAGLGIDAAFNRVGASIARSHPRMATLLAQVSLELRAGRSREEALRQLARRSGVTEIATFATLVIQSDKLGASIAQALRIYAAEMREARRLRAEEKAHRIPVLLSVPLVGFLLPTMVAVLMLPAALKMKAQFATTSSVSASR